MRRGTWGDDLDAIYRVSRSGVIRTAELARLGVSNSAVHTRCRVGGPWQRILPGVVLLRNGQPTPRQRSIAALMLSGDDSLLTGRSAMSEYGYRTHSGDVQVLIPIDRRVQSVGFVTVERTVRLPEPEIRNGLRCAPLPRALLDAARRYKALDPTRALIAEAVQRGDVSVRELAKELEAGSSRGSALPRVVLREVNANVHSVPEVHARKLWQRSGLPEMLFNHEIRDANGDFIAVPDGWIDSVAFAWDIDSLEWHAAPTDYKRTVERRTRMQNAGIIVLPTVPSALRTDPDRVIEDLRAHYRLAQSRPRPQVFARSRWVKLDETG
ncbi:MULTISPECIES: hypothetical protein [Rhodococcus]|uniref:hypothetical protein n=1 Tax=Rhodococcus TaxID=1827 RepID=UPI001C4EDD5C|nr:MULTISPECIES: hypothetical protein [Rhodococcus]MBW0292237.1 hypothetical protein [Rhodococcus sp. MH15]MDJ0433375.1 hypothetical protein [Rhodococcus qingshengii]